MTDGVRQEIESLFRRESGRLLAVLTRILGAQNLELAEDVLQESFVAALEHWTDSGLPDNAEGWLLTTAKNRAIDAIRRERTRRTFAPDLAVFLDSEWTLSRTVDDAFHDDWVRDDQLRMIFMCCAPKIEPENRLPIILKTLCGLGVPAIARALLTTESTINKRLYRTRRSLNGEDFRLPTADELPEARAIVHTVLYLLFNEGYFSTATAPILKEVCRDAMSLVRLLADEPTVANSDTVALLALMSFGAARLESRLDDAGFLVPLDRQDRLRWDAGLIRQGYTYLQRSSEMEAVEAGQYHIEAAIAARHCSAASFGDTDWVSICNLYDRLLEVTPSALTRLNRAIAISYRSGPEEAIGLVEALHSEGQLQHSHVVVASLANLYGRAGRHEQATHYLKAALAQAGTEHERRLIERQAMQPGR